MASTRRVGLVPAVGVSVPELTTGLTRDPTGDLTAGTVVLAPLPDPLDTPPGVAATDRSRRLAAVLTVAGGTLVSTLALVASQAGFAEQVILPDWWGPWPTGTQADAVWGAGVVLLTGALCLLWSGIARRWFVGAHVPPVRAVVTMAVAWGVALLPTGPMASLDVQSYAAVGRLAALGLDPYLVAPGALGGAYANAVSPMWQWTATPYGPVQVALLAMVAHLAGAHVAWTVLGIRALAVAGLVAAVWLAHRACSVGDRVAVLALTALNPLVLVHVVSGAHLDVIVGALAVLVVTTNRAGRPALAAVLAVVAMMVKLPGALLLGYLAFDLVRRTPKDERWVTALRVLLAAGGAVAFIAVAFPDAFGWLGTLSVPGSTHEGMAPSTWVSVLVAAVMGWTSGPSLTTAFAVGRTLTEVVGGVGILVLLWRAAGGDARAAYRGVGWALVLLAFCGPTTYPWYLTWGLFAAAVGSGPRGRWGLLVASVTLTLLGSFTGGPAALLALLAVGGAVLAQTLHRRGRTVTV